MLSSLVNPQTVSACSTQQQESVLTLGGQGLWGGAVTNTASIRHLCCCLSPSSVSWQLDDHRVLLSHPDRKALNVPCQRWGPALCRDGWSLPLLSGSLHTHPREESCVSWEVYWWPACSPSPLRRVGPLLVSPPSTGKRLCGIYVIGASNGASFSC